MRRIYLFTIFALLLSSFNIPGISFAANTQKPLMIIRFADDSVDYEQSLDKAVKMAVDKKQSVVFDIQAISRQTTDSSTNRQNQNDTKFFADKIIDQIKQSGVSAENIKVSFTSNKSVRSNEIQIFVQ